MSIQSAEFSRAHHAALEHVLIQRMSIQSAELSRAHHAAVESVHIQH